MESLTVMTAVAERTPAQVLAETVSAADPSPGRRRPWRAISWPRVGLLVLAAANALLFLAVRPNVNDLWAARARAEAAHDGVGLTYWFSWFGGGSTPGNYSVLTPYLSAWLTAELLCAISAVAIPALAAVLLRGSRHPIAGTAVAVFVAGVNLWSGRVPFLFSSAIALVALIAVVRRRPYTAGVLSIVSILASPVAAVFMAIGLVGSMIVTRSRDFVKTGLITLAGIAIGLGGVALAFGSPGPEPFPAYMQTQVVLSLLLMLLARPPANIKLTIWISIPATYVIAAIPNGMGSNFARFVWFCLPVVIVATSEYRKWILALLVTPVLITGTWGTYVDLRNAALPISADAYYKPLVNEVDTLPGLNNYRLEVVDHGAHAAYETLLGHAQLARGWETQEDLSLNPALYKKNLGPIKYKIWLDNNAVGYVALPTQSVRGRPEYRLVANHPPPYLHLVWETANWRLYRVSGATPIVAGPGWVTSPGQASLSIDVACACTVQVRTHWSKFLRVQSDGGTGVATLANDGHGWTTLTASQPGVYVLRGSLAGGLLP
jgi:hypothetical protein